MPAEIILTAEDGTQMRFTTEGVDFYTGETMFHFTIPQARMFQAGIERFDAYLDKMETSDAPPTLPAAGGN